MGASVFWQLFNFCVSRAQLALLRIAAWGSAEPLPTLLGQRNITSLSMAAYEEDLEARVLAALARADAVALSGGGVDGNGVTAGQQTGGYPPSPGSRLQGGHATYNNAGGFGNPPAGWLDSVYGNPGYAGWTSQPGYPGGGGFGVPRRWCRAYAAWWPIRRGSGRRPEKHAARGRSTHAMSVWESWRARGRRRGREARRKEPRRVCVCLMCVCVSARSVGRARCGRRGAVRMPGACCARAVGDRRRAAVVSAHAGRAVHLHRLGQATGLVSAAIHASGLPVQCLQRFAGELARGLQMSSTRRAVPPLQFLSEREQRETACRWT